MAIFSFDIEPLAQARPRIAPRPYPHIYDPNNVKKYKEELHSLAIQKMKESGLKLFDGALFIKISFCRQNAGEKLAKCNHFASGKTGYIGIVEK